MASIQQLLIALCLSLTLVVVEGFAPSPLVGRVAVSAQSSSSLQVAPIDALLQGTPSTTVAAATLDPTTFLSDLLSVFISSNAILAVPIIAALGVAGLVAFAIVAYANPAEPEDD